MHSLILNRVAISLELAPRTGLLIKEGNKERALLRPDEPDLQPVRMRVGEEETVFLPGSSLKGALRAAAERHLRGLAPTRDLVARYACDPLDMRESPCHNAGRLRGAGDRPPGTAEIHARQCLACRTFGSQQIAGRIRFTDALPPAGRKRREANRTDPRAGVAIDRRTGAADSGKLFEADVVSGGAFETTLHLHNVQLWQVGLVATLLEELELGLLRIGGGGTRGLGRVGVELRGLEWWQRGRLAVPAGVGALLAAGPGSDATYGWLEDGALSELALPEPELHLGGRRWRLGGERVRPLLAEAERAGWASLERWTPREARAHA